LGIDEYTVELPQPQDQEIWALVSRGSGSGRLKA
jgi:hypothetical protein